MNSIVLPPTYAADLVRAVPVGKDRKATGWTGDVFHGSAKLDVQCATARTINQKSITNLPTAAMAAPELADDVFAYSLRIR